MTTPFPPTREAALARLAAIDPRAYARTRNALDGHVSRLSPYLTHGIVTVPEVLDALIARGCAPQEKIVFELAWREYWHHAWRHLGDGIFRARRPREALAGAATNLPPDVVEARTGVPVIDAAVRALYRDGYVHNHARMWLASYLVHLRKVDWLVAARWMYTHLLDGDLASNTLSWQWVAGTWTGKPYLFNNDNVARHAPALAKAGTVIDRSREALDAIAAGSVPCGAEPDAPADGVAVPTVEERPPVRGDALPAIQGRDVVLVHPWMLGEREGSGPRIGVIHLPFHARYPWSGARWRFVIERLRAVTDAIWVGDLGAFPVGGAACRSVATLAPGYREALDAICSELLPSPRVFTDPPVLHASFSRFWAAAGRRSGA